MLGALGRQCRRPGGDRGVQGPQFGDAEVASRALRGCEVVYMIYRGRDGVVEGKGV